MLVRESTERKFAALEANATSTTTSTWNAAAANSLSVSIAIIHLFNIHNHPADVNSRYELQTIPIILMTKQDVIPFLTSIPNLTVDLIGAVTI